MVQAHSIGAGTAAEMPLLVGDNPECIRSEGALAKLCGAYPIRASSGKTSRPWLNRGGNRHANAALYRVIIGCMRGRLLTTCAGAHQRKRKIRDHPLLKRFVVREIFCYLCRTPDKKPKMKMIA